MARQSQLDTVILNESGLNPLVWENELIGDVDRDFLLKGIFEGFDIVDDNVKPLPAECNNYLSATDVSVKAKVEKQILYELEHGHYEITEKRPVIVSALGAIPKPASEEVRIIHDCSRPIGTSINDLATKFSVKYQTIEEAVSLSSPGCFYSKIDLKSAYRSVKIHPDNYKLTGIKWHFDGNEGPLYLFDKRLPFGARKSPAIFHRLTQAVRRMMARRGFNNIVVYLDDFLIIEDTEIKCLHAMRVLIDLLRSLGFWINWSKVVDPSQKVTFLGINIDSISYHLTLPNDKMDETIDLLRWFRDKTRASKKQLQRLAGKLNWASRVIRGGRTYLRRVLDLQNQINLPFQKAKLSDEFRADIDWWLTFMSMFNGVQMCKKFSVGNVHVDASNTAAGIAYNGDWAYVNWKLDWPEVANFHINHKEVLSIIIAARKWGHLWSNASVTVLTDSECAKHIIKKGTTPNKTVMKYLRELFWLSALYNFELVPVHIKGHDNILPDTISRLHEKGKPYQLDALLWQFFQVKFSITTLHIHMSFKSLLFLLLQTVTNSHQKWTWTRT